VLDAVGHCDEALGAFAAADLWRRLAQACRVCVGRVPLLESTAAAPQVGGINAVTKDPIATLGAFTYYAERVAQDCADLPGTTRGACLRRLGEQAAAELLRDPDHRPWGEILARQARQQFEPKVSVVIPVYNGADYLAAAIDSALGQTYHNLEVVVINDGSTDDGASERIACSYGDRIRYFSQPNGGVASALNRGIDVMTGDYFSWLSHDDLYVPEKLEIQLAALTWAPDPSRVVLYSDFDIFTTDPSEAEPGPSGEHVPPKDFRYHITVANTLHGCTLLVPRDAFTEHGRFDTALRTTQDYDFWFRIAEGFAFVHQPRVLVHARSHPDQGSMAMSGLVERECNALLGGFVERLSTTEVQRDGDESVADGYLRLAYNLDLRGFKAASARALERWSEHQHPGDHEDHEARCRALALEVARARGDRERHARTLAREYEAVIQQLTEQCADRERLAREYEAVSEQLTQQCADREAAAEALALREELDSIYGSRSWALITRLRQAWTWIHQWRR
jgi:glycosyltransferase involved in cell wall biosynthesis